MFRCLELRESECALVVWQAQPKAFSPNHTRDELLEVGFDPAMLDRGVLCSLAAQSARPTTAAPTLIRFWRAEADGCGLGLPAALTVHTWRESCRSETTQTYWCFGVAGYGLCSSRWFRVC